MSSKLPVHKLTSPEGLSLLEVMLAIAIVVVSLTSLVAIANTATSNVAASRGRTIADQHVRAGIESMRHLRDNARWQGLLTANGTSAQLGNGASRYYSINASGVVAAQSLSPSIKQPCGEAAVQTATYRIETGYYRIAQITLNEAGTEARIKVTVCYGYRAGKYQQVSADTMLTNWR